jgi:hypothetical protein
VRTKLDVIAELFDLFPTRGLAPDDASAIPRARAALTELADPDLVCVWVGPDPAFRTELRGVDGFIEGWLDWLTAFESYRVELDESFEGRDAIVTFVRHYGVPTGGAHEVEEEAAGVWWFNEARKLVRVEFHLDRENAVRAAGLGNR